jgi:hypothetical protein
VKVFLFAGRYPFHFEGPEQVATLLEQFSQKPNPDDACEVARLMIEAARSGDSEFFRKLGNWVDNAHNKPDGYGIDGDAVDQTIRDYIAMGAGDKNLPKLTGPEVLAILKFEGFNVSLKYAFNHLRKVEAEIEEERAKWSAKSS